jgi:hypothetical protein
MPKVKVKDGLVWWQHEVTDDDGKKRLAHETAFRGMIIEVPKDEAKRLRDLGAVIDPSEELPLGGELSPVPSTASDNELVAWVSVANRQDILDAIRQQPELGDRILAAHEIVQRQLQEQSEFLGGIKPDIERVQAEAVESNATGADGGVGDGDGDVTNDDDDDDVDADDVVKGNVDAISKFLSENPSRHADILEAEKRRAAADGAKPANVRDGVVMAVQAAAAHTTN